MDKEMAATSNPLSPPDADTPTGVGSLFVEVDGGRVFSVQWLLSLACGGLMHVVAVIALLIPGFFSMAQKDALMNLRQRPPVTLVAPPEHPKVVPKSDESTPSLCPKCPFTPPPPLKEKSSFKATANANAKVRLDFPRKDRNHYLPKILARYRQQGSRVGFGDGVAKYLFEAPPSRTKLATPDEGVALDYFYWFTIIEPEKYSFISEIRNAQPDTRLLTPYALFPFSFQDAVERLIRSHPDNKCATTEIAIGSVEFDIQPGPGVKVLSITCEPDSSTGAAVREKISSK